MTARDPHLRPRSPVIESPDDAMTSLPPPRRIVGVPVHPVRLREALQWIGESVAARRGAIVFNVNAYAILLAQRDPHFCAALHEADLVFCDGQGVRLASHLLGRPLPERFTPPDWVGLLAEQAAHHGWRLFLLGARPGVAARAAERLQAAWPTLDVRSHHGYFDLEGAGAAEALEQVRQARPDILIVGMGMPRQERWVIENRARHGAPVTIVVGGLFDYMAGDTPRGPRWLTDHGLEWLCRLWYEPRRLWRRYLLGNPAFVLLVLRQWWRLRRRG